MAVFGSRRRRFRKNKNGQPDSPPPGHEDLGDAEARATEHAEHDADAAPPVSQARSESLMAARLLMGERDPQRDTFYSDLLERERAMRTVEPGGRAEAPSAPRERARAEAPPADATSAEATPRAEAIARRPAPADAHEEGAAHEEPPRVDAREEHSSRSFMTIPTPAGATMAGEPSGKPSHSEARDDRNRTRKKNVAQVGKSTTFKGELIGEEDLEIEGRIEGSVNVPDHQVTVGPGGNVTADVQSKSVVIVGRIEGNVIASERVEIHNAGVVEGDIKAPALVIQEGATVNGNISMGASAMRKVEAPSSASRDEVA